MKIKIKNNNSTDSNKQTSYKHYKRKMNLAASCIFFIYGLALLNPNKIAVRYINRFGEVRTTDPSGDNTFDFILGTIIIIVSLFYIKKFWK